MEEDAADAEPLRQRAGVLPAGAPEDDQRVVAHVVAARDRHLPDRLGHVRVRDREEAGRDVGRRAPAR